MKRALIIVFLLTLAGSGIAQGQMVDVVFLKNGSVISGIIIELIPDKTVKIQTSDGSIFVYNMSEVEKITKEPTTGGYVDDSQIKNRLESWYLLFSLGYANVSYPDELEPVLDALEKAPGVTHMTIGMDLFGVYFPTDERTLIGGLINAWGDRYETSSMDFQINGFLYSISAMHFITERIGQGVFIRGDIGGAKIGITSSFSDDITSEWGYGGLVGGGYGFSVTPGTRILLNVNYSFSSVEDESYGCFAISLSGLF